MLSVVEKDSNSYGSTSQSGHGTMNVVCLLFWVEIKPLGFHLLNYSLFNHDKHAEMVFTSCEHRKFTFAGLYFLEGIQETSFTRHARFSSEHHCTTPLLKAGNAQGHFPAGRAGWCGIPVKQLPTEHPSQIEATL